MDMVWNYPYNGDLEKVRSMIRAAEGSISVLLENTGDWVEIFWNACLNETYPEVFLKKKKSKLK